MTTKTKYSRSTWKKKQLQQTMNTPHYGSNACSLCKDGSIPVDLNVHVTDLQTCADVHLQLALLRYDNAMCAVGQEEYQELCCPKKSSNKLKLKTSLGFLASVFLIGFIFQKLLSRRNSPHVERAENKNKKTKGLSMTHQSKSGSDTEASASNQSKGSSELEMAYQNMDNNIALMMKRSISQPRTPSKSRPQSRSRSRGRPQNRQPRRQCASSRNHGKKMADGSSRSSSSVRRSTSRAAPDSHPRSISWGRATQNRSRSRSKSRDCRRDHWPKNPVYVVPPVHVVGYNPNPYYRHEEVEVCSNVGLILPTQLV